MPRVRARAQAGHRCQPGHPTHHQTWNQQRQEVEVGERKCAPSEHKCCRTDQPIDRQSRSQARQERRAARLFAWADAMHSRLADPRPPIEQASVERDLGVIRLTLTVLN